MQYFHSSKLLYPGYGRSGSGASNSNTGYKVEKFTTDGMPVYSSAQCTYTLIHT